MKALIVLAIAAAAHAAPPIVPPRDARETQWSDYIAKSWKESGMAIFAWTEYRLPDDSRVDIFEHHNKGGQSLTVAWEVERAAKWKEAIGQAAFYQALSGSERGGVVLILLGDPDDKLCALRCAMACQRCGLAFVSVNERGIICGGVNK